TGVWYTLFHKIRATFSAACHQLFQNREPELGLYRGRSRIKFDLYVQQKKPCPTVCGIGWVLCQHPRRNSFYDQQWEYPSGGRYQHDRSAGWIEVRLLFYQTPSGFRLWRM